MIFEVLCLGGSHDGCRAKADNAADHFNIAERSPPGAIPPDLPVKIERYTFHEIRTYDSGGMLSTRYLGYLSSLSASEAINRLVDNYPGMASEEPYPSQSDIEREKRMFMDMMAVRSRGKGYL